MPVKVLLVQTRGRIDVDRAERARRQKAGEEPRSLLFAETLGCDILDEETVAAVPGARGAIYKRLPAFIAQAIEARRRCPEYDVVISWSERHTVAIAGLFALTRPSTPHLAMLFWMSKPSVRIPLRWLRGGVDRIVTWSSVQQRVAIDRLHFSPHDVVLVRHPVDTYFFSPREREHAGVFSAGSTMRDFETLVSAVRDTDIPCRIAASWVVVLNGLRVRQRDASVELDHPANVRVEPVDALELREMYASASVVVVPLLPSDIDAGVNVILEAMAMGRPVIVSRTQGQVDVVRDGVNGVFVPHSDPLALRATLEALLADPAGAEEMGARARAFVVGHHRLEDFIEAVRVQVEDLASRGVCRRDKARRKHWWRSQPVG